MRFVFGQTVAWTDNPDLETNPGDPGFYSSTFMTLAYRSVTSRDRFEFDFDGQYDIGDVLENTGLVDPTVRLRYTRESANARLSAFAFYQQRDLNDRTTTLAQDVDGDGIDDTLTPITLSRGNQELYRYGFNYETGLRSPFGLSLYANRYERRYSDIQTSGPFFDPDLFDSDETVAGISARFEIDPRITLRTGLRQTYYTAEDEEETERETTRLTVGGTFLVDQRTEVALDIGSERVVTDDITGRDEEQGLALDFGVLHEMQNGTLGFTAVSGVNQNGRIDTVRATRAMTLNSGAELSFSAGAGGAGGADTPLFGFSYAQDFETYRIAANLLQQIRTDNNDDNTEWLDTRFRATYERDLSRTVDLIVAFNLNDYDTLSGETNDRQRVNLGIGLTGQINSVSNWGLGFDYVTTNVDEDNGSSDENEYGFDITYERLLTRDVSLLASYEYVFRDDVGSSDTDSNTLSLTVRKAFSIRP